MDAGIEPLAHAVVKAPAREAVHGLLVSHIVAMREQELLAHHVHDGITFNHREPHLGGEIVEEPHIVVASKPVDFHATVGELGEFAQEAHMPARHHRLVLIPVVQNVAQQEQLGGIVLDAVEEIDQAPFVLTLVLNILRPQVSVG